MHACSCTFTLVAYTPAHPQVAGAVQDKLPHLSYRHTLVVHSCRAHLITHVHTPCSHNDCTPTGGWSSARQAAPSVVQTCAGLQTGQILQTTMDACMLSHTEHVYATAHTHRWLEKHKTSCPICCAHTHTGHKHTRALAHATAHTHRWLEQRKTSCPICRADMRVPSDGPGPSDDQLPPPRPPCQDAQSQW